MRRISSALTLLLVSTAVGCDIYNGETKGESGVLGFYEPNAYPADLPSSAVGFERPIALGARADVWILAPGLSSITSATVDDPEIVSLSLATYPIMLRGLAPGTTTLRVATSGGSDTLPLTVLRPDGANLWVETPTPTFSFSVPDSFFGSGSALRPGASVTVAAEPLAGATPLLGFELFTWTVEPPLLSDDSAGSAVNTRHLTALGASGVARVTTQLGGELELVTLAPTDPVTLRAYSVVAFPDPPTEITALAPADVASFAIAGTDAAGQGNRI